jgi:hypothetical protein
MEAENLLMFAVSSQDFLPASIQQLREKADKSLDHASQIVTRQRYFADYDAKWEGCFGILHLHHSRSRGNATQFVPFLS